MMTKRRNIDAALKANIALEAVREQACVADLVQRYEVHPNRFLRGRSCFWSRLRAPLIRSVVKPRRWPGREIDALVAGLDAAQPYSPTY
jgi:transposase-like protein